MDVTGNKQQRHPSSIMNTPSIVETVFSGNNTLQQRTTHHIKQMGQANLVENSTGKYKG